MQEAMRPVIHKTPVQNLSVNVARAGFSIGDPAELHLTPGGELAIFAWGRHSLLGIIPMRKLLYLGQLATPEAALLIESFIQNHPMRLRIVGLTPEHLAGENGPEICVSVWASLPSSMVPPPFALS